MNQPAPADSPKPDTMKQVWRWAIALPVLALLFQYVAVAPIGTGMFLSGLAIMGMLLLATLPAIIVLPFLLLNKRLRKPALRWWSVCIVYTGLFIASVLIGNKIRMAEFAALAKRSAPLVTAIADYTAQHGSPPENLQELVPQYLEEVPRTGIMAYPEYKYEVAPQAERYHSNPWVLYIPCTSGGLNWDEFVYLPQQNYDAEMSHDYYERVHDWGYLHE
ncbi:hypothetical protein Rhal01_00651 [Rubritalea halochordaticola]|uniref:DUF1559 domain-containing protein n=1 Tax=Rubritalea halochordaticola TaxID=714537 RepID=A0ABP9UVN8_9BACT